MENNSSQKLLIKNIKTIISCDDNDTVYKNSFIYSENGIIKEIDSMDKINSSYLKIDSIVDASNCVVYPGLINTHHHLYQTFSRNLPETQNMELFEWLEFLFNKWKNIDEDVVYYSAIVGLGELLKTGCTTCVDQNDSIPKKYSKTVVEKEFAAAEKLGIRLCLGRGSLDIGDDISDNLLQTVNEIINDSEDAIKKYHDSSFNSMKNIILAPCAPFCSSKICYIKTAELGRKYNVRLNTHLAETLDEEKWCLEKYGKRPLEFMKECDFIGKDVFYNHGIHFNEDEIKLLGESGTGVAHCPTSNMKLSSGIMDMKNMRKYKVNIGLGVDGSASNDCSNLLNEMRNCFLLHRLNESHDAPNGYDILKMATKGGAKLIGRNELGCIKVGNSCDLFMILCKGIEMVGCDHDFKSYLCTVGHKGDVYMTVVNGKIVFKEGKLMGLDNEEEIIKKAKEVENEYINKK